MDVPKKVKRPLLQNTHLRSSATQHNQEQRLVYQKYSERDLEEMYRRFYYGDECLGDGRNSIALSSETLSSRKDIQSQFQQIEVSLNTSAPKMTIINENIERENQVLSRTKNFMNKRVRSNCQSKVERSKFVGHFVPELVSKSENPKNINECDVCQYSCSTEAELNKHTRLNHTMPKSYPCNLCKRSFTIRSTLFRHYKSVHQKVRDFQCDKCVFVCSRLDGLKVHKKIHDKMKDKNCIDYDSECGSSCLLAGDAKNTNSYLTMRTRSANEVKCHNYTKSKPMCDVNNKNFVHIRAPKHVSRGIPSDLKAPKSYVESAYAIPMTSVKETDMPTLKSVQEQGTNITRRQRNMSNTSIKQRNKKSRISKRLKCSDCQYTASTKRRLQTHITKAHTEEMILTICNDLIKAIFTNHRN